MSIEQIGLVVLFILFVVVLICISFIFQDVFSDIRFLEDREEILSKRMLDLNGLYQTKTTTTTINPRKPKTFKVKPPGRTPRLYSFEGIQHPIKKWAQLVGMSKKTLYQRVYKGLPLLTPEEFARISKGVQ